METKNCPYCGGEIMKSAKKCKHCGEWLEERTQSTPMQSTTPTVTDEVEIKHSNTKKIVLIIVGVLVLAFIIWIIVLKNQKSDWEKAMEEYNSQSSYTEEAPIDVVYEEYTSPSEDYSNLPVYESGGPCPYDGVPDYEYEETYSDRTEAYDPNSSANAWN